MFKDGVIGDVIVNDLRRFTDPRGWLVEIFRNDELDDGLQPVMGYISMTEKGVVRGPHEHVDQADLFCFLGPSTFRVYLWDNRSSSPTFRVRQIITAGVDEPKSIIIPKGVVHAYKNVGDGPGMVVNCPNRLYAGEGKKQPVDEIRHEDDPDTVFSIEGI